MGELSTLENLKIAFKCTTCQRVCKQLILSGDIQYCPKYKGDPSNTTVKKHAKELKVYYKW